MSSMAEQADQPSLQLAQAYDFDVYIDQYGREIIVDAYTGEVVEIRPPRGGRRPAPPPRLREYGGQVYDFTDPRDVERYRRDRRAGLERGIPDDYFDPNYTFPERPRNDRPARGRGENVERRPLNPPVEQPQQNRQNEIAAIPDEQEQLEEAQPTSPRSPTTGISPAKGVREEVASYQVLLDRVGASPGVIDGRMGENVNKAISTYREITGQSLRTYDQDWIQAELERTGGGAFMDYTITAEDAAGPFIASVPADYGEKAQLERMAFTSVSEMLAERFHMDEKYLKELNPGANFNRPGTRLRVVNPGERVKGKVARIVADKSAKQVRAYNEDGQLLAAYPATIGSSSTPSPTGTHTVERIALNPQYTYNPKINFKQGNNDKVLTIPPGPNGPVGSVWIALSKPTYGIHGTPDPSKIGKTASHGCIRLTNWDAEELAKQVKPGVSVVFVE